MTRSPSDNVVEFDGVTTLNIPPTRILAKAAGAKLKECVVIGHDENGDFYFASSVADGGTVLWLMAQAQKKLLEVEA